MEAYSREIEDFTEKYGCLAKMTLMEEPDIDTQEYIFSFESVEGTSQKELDEIFLEVTAHMEEFSKRNGIEKFSRCAMVWI